MSHEIIYYPTIPQYSDWTGSILDYDDGVTPDDDATYVSNPSTPDVDETFCIPGISPDDIPDIATIESITLYARARNTNSTSPFTVCVGNGSVFFTPPDDIVLTTSYVDYSWEMPLDLQTVNQWQVSVLRNWDQTDLPSNRQFGCRNRTVNADTVRVTSMWLKITFSDLVWEQVGSGGAALGGGSTVSVDFVAAGGATGGSSFDVAVKYDLDVSGGVTAAGDGNDYISVIVEGGAAVAGDADIPGVMPYIASGGTIHGGVAEHNINAQETGLGGAVLGGTTKVADLRIFGFVASGSVLTSGSSNSGFKHVKVEATGGIELGSNTTANYRFHKDLTLLWNKQNEIRKDFTFMWNVGQLQTYWYRIVGKGKVDPCQPNDGCCQKFLLNVHARTPAELCEKLSRRRLRFPIESVQRFSRPAETSAIANDEAAGINHDCNTLIPVDVCHIPACADFCVEEDIRQTVGFFMKVQVDAFSNHEASGNVFISGSAGTVLWRNVPDFPYNGTGSLSVAGSADCGTNSYSGQGGGSLGGSAHISANRWTYVGGVWPTTTSNVLGTISESFRENAGEQIWSLPERVLTNNSQYASSDISFGQTTELLVVQGFRFNVPEGSNILGIKVRIDRLATQTKVRDNELYLVSGGRFITANLADKVNDWPLIETTKIYGSDGTNGVNDWRDDDSDYFTGPFESDEVNDSTFGVAFKAKAVLSLPTTVVKIDYIGIEIFYEDEQGSLIRTSGEAKAVGPTYHWASSGRVLIASDAQVKKSVLYTTSDTSPSSPPHLSIGGAVSINYIPIDGSGGATLGGLADVTPYFEEGSGGASLAGLAKVMPFIEVAAGGVQLGGLATRDDHFYYDASGSISISGSAVTPEIQFSYTTSGSVSTSGSARVRLPFYAYAATGSVLTQGSAGQKPSDIGTAMQNLKFGMSITQLSAVFAEDVELGDAVGPADLVSQCGCFTMPLVIELTQNLNRGNIFSKFLIRNAKTISRVLKLNYNEPNNSWQTNLHYKGLGPDSTSMETWDLTFELQCTDTVGAIALGRTIWKLAVQVFRKNLATGEDYDTRILLGVLPEPICGTNSNQLNFQIDFDTQLKFAVVSPSATVYQNTLFDNIGLFRNPAWLEDPVLVFRVSQIGTAREVQRLDLTDAVLV